MPDRFTKAQRSKTMAAIRSSGNKTTELALIDFFRANKIKGWRRGYRGIEGRPDFVFLRHKVAVFVDGCFWHGCPACKLASKSNIDYWQSKISKNKARDRLIGATLRKKGWNVIRIWEHRLHPKGNKKQLAGQFTALEEK